MRKQREIKKIKWRRSLFFSRLARCSASIVGPHSVNLHSSPCFNEKRQKLPARSYRDHKCTKASQRNPLGKLEATTVDVPGKLTLLSDPFFRGAVLRGRLQALVSVRRARQRVPAGQGDHVQETRPSRHLLQRGGVRPASHHLQLLLHAAGLRVVRRWLPSCNSGDIKTPLLKLGSVEFILTRQAAEIFVDSR